MSAKNGSAQANNFMNFLTLDCIVRAGQQRAKRSQLEASEWSWFCAACSPSEDIGRACRAW
jgi:hypothetical protein